MHKADVMRRALIRQVPTQPTPRTKIRLLKNGAIPTREER